MEGRESTLLEQAKGKDSYTYLKFLALSLRIASIYFIDSIPLTFTYYMLKQKDDLYLTSTLGLGLTYQFFSFSFLYGFGDAFGVWGSRLFGAKKYSAFTVLYFRSVILLSICLVSSVALILASPYVLSCIGISDDLVGRIVWFLYWSAAERVLDSFNTLGRCVIISQEISKVFIYINIACLSTFFIISTTCFTYFQMGLGGYIIAKYAKSILEFLMQLYFQLNYSNKEMLFIPEWKDIKSSFWKTLSFYSYIGFGIYGEIMVTEISTEFAGYSHDLVQISAYASFVNIAFFLGSIGFGMSSTLRTHCNIEKGKGDTEKMLWVAKLYYKYALLTGIITGVLVYLSAPYMALLFSNDEGVLSELVRLLRIYAFFLTVNYNVSFTGSYLRTLDRAKQAFYCNAIFFPLAMVTAASICTYKYHMANDGLIASYAFAILTTYGLIMVLMYSASKKTKIGLAHRPEFLQIGTMLCPEPKS